MFIRRLTDIDMGLHKITNLGDGVLNTDAISRRYFESRLRSIEKNMNNKKITNLLASTKLTDAVYIQQFKTTENNK